MNGRLPGRPAGPSRRGRRGGAGRWDLGLTTAYLLTQAGRAVVVVEAAGIAEGVSGHTTAKITSQHNLIYAELAGKFGRDKAALYGRSQQAALDWIAAQVTDLKIDCDFRRRDNHVYAESPAYRQKLHKEAEIAAALGLPAEFVDEPGLPFAVAGAVRFRIRPSSTRAGGCSGSPTG